MGAQHTPGPWAVPHFAIDEVQCNCRYIFGGDSFMGGIGEVYVDNGKPISDGGNDCPSLDEAKANARLIAASPDFLVAAQEFVSPYAGLDEGKLNQAVRLTHGDVLRFGDLALTPHVALSVIAARAVIAKATGA